MLITAGINAINYCVSIYEGVVALGGQALQSVGDIGQAVGGLLLKVLGA